MLGGSVYIAFMRFAISLAGVIILFSRISESRFDRNKTIVCYGCFSVVVLILASAWYVADWKSCVRIVAFAMYACFAVFAIILSSDSVYLSIYKLALTFYLLAVFLVGGLEVAIIYQLILSLIFSLYPNVKIEPKHQELKGACQNKIHDNLVNTVRGHLLCIWI